MRYLPTPAQPGHHQGQIGQGENKAKSPKLMLNGSHPISREGRVARSALGWVVKLTNIILNTLGSPQPPQPYCPIHSLLNSSLPLHFFHISTSNASFPFVPVLLI